MSGVTPKTIKGPELQIAGLQHYSHSLLTESRKAFLSNQQ